MELLFLSFTTLSSTGLSDIVPVSGHARSVVMLEQVAGVFYIAMVVTRLVALRGQRAAGRAVVSAARARRPEPQSVRQARSWVVDELAAIGRPDLVDAAELGVSELVTNAILHADAADHGPRRRHGQHPRVEVARHLAPRRLALTRHDRRRQAARHRRPRARHRRDVLHQLGRRGLPASGKVVWFEPRRADARARPRPATSSTSTSVVDAAAGRRRRARRPAHGPAARRCRSQVFAPLPRLVRRAAARAAAAGAQPRRRLPARQRALRADPAGRAGAAAGQRHRPARRGDRGRRRTGSTWSTTSRRPRGATMARLRELLEQARRVLPRAAAAHPRPTPQQLELRRWYLGEFARQAAGEDPMPWPGALSRSKPPAVSPGHRAVGASVAVRSARCCATR